MDDIILGGETTPQKQPKRKGIKTADVKRLKREGHSIAAICNKLNVSTATVSYHLAKKRKDKGTTRVKAAVTTAPDTTFEVELFGTTIKLDKAPNSIEKIGTKLIIN